MTINPTEHNKQELIIGIDEAGRGALVGPVYAACCFVPDDFDINILKDSKKLSEKKREELRQIIIEKCIYGIGFATHKEIDKLNILNATFLAMQRAFEKFLKSIKDTNFDLSFAHIIVDGNILPHFLKKYDNTSLFNPVDKSFKASTLIKGDNKIPAIMAASILAKTERDRIMRFADIKWPQYSFASHKGYGTKKHILAIKKFAPSPIARKSFKVPGM